MNRLLPGMAGYTGVCRDWLNIRNIRIQSRLIFLFVVLSLLPMVVTGFFSDQQTSRAIRSKINKYSLQIVNQVAKNIMVEMKRLENDTTEIGYSDIVQQTLSRAGQYSDWEIIDAKYRIRSMLLNKFSFFSNVSDVLLFTGSNTSIVVYGDESYRLNFKPAYQQRLLSKLRERGGLPVWQTVGWDDEDHLVNRIIDYENGILTGKAIKSLYEGEYIGAVVIRVKEKFFARIYQDIDIGNGSEIFVLDSAGVVVSSGTARLPFKQPYPEAELLKILQANEQKGQRVFDIRLGQQSCLAAFAPVETAGWYVVSTVPYTYLHEESRQIRNNIIWLGIFCFVLAILLSVIFTRSIAGPLNRLIDAMNQVRQGNLNVEVVDPNHDEIGEVASNFNAMVREISRLVDDVKQKETQKRKAEFQALQAQINPHFLSNILNTAKLLANTQKADNLESLLGSLIQLLHVSMGKEAEFITVQKEIEYLQNYVNLQEFRFFHKFQLHLEIEPAIMDCRLPRFLLQPILENAIIHGIGPKKGPGLIEVKGFAYDGRMIFTITDDGIGMDPERARSLLEDDSPSSNRFCGIGIKNVQDRIRLYFGEPYGLRLDSSPNCYTSVEIILPIIPMEGADGSEC